MKDIRILNKKKITLQELDEFYKILEYKKLYELVLKLIDNRIIKPVKSSKKNGKKPSLYTMYWVQQLKEDNSKYIDELNYKLNHKLDTAYYLKNIDKYKEDREFILKLNNFLADQEKYLINRISLNERSFEIWQREKFILCEGGIRIIKNLGLAIEVFNFYKTREPLSYFSNSKTTPQNILIIENKDTFYSMRKFLLAGNTKIFGMEISTLIYGGGKSVLKSFEDFEHCVEPYLTEKSNTILYLGDLDYEGILIYEILVKIFKDKYKIKPFTFGYKAMVDKYLANNLDLPETKEKQNRNITNLFFTEFDEKFCKIVIKFLQENKYIPQEIVNIGDFGI